MYDIINLQKMKERNKKMTVKDLITKLLDYPMDANVIVNKELDYNIWVNSEPIISEANANCITLSFDFPTEKFEIKRK